MPPANPLLVDIHTHIYPPAYIELLAARTTVPYIHRPPPPSPSAPAPPPRLIILPTDDTPDLPPAARGRPVDASYTSLDAKLAFMRRHGIRASVLSLANPWLDFLPAAEAAAAARLVNDDVAALCAEARRSGGEGGERLFFFAALPLSAPAAEVAAEIRRLKQDAQQQRYCKGVVLGTAGPGGRGLDDAALEPVWAALAAAPRLPAFVHPHYGIAAEAYGPRMQESGHVMPLALGFPVETTVAFVRMYLAGVFARHPELKLILAHAGGCLPFLAGRVESCIRHERALRDGEGKVKAEFREGVWEALKRNVWLDGVVYSAIGVKAAAEAVGGWEKVLWGTDHPFFPPIGEEAEVEGEPEWESVRTNIDAAKGAFADEKAVKGVLGENAVRLLGLELDG